MLSYQLINNISSATILIPLVVVFIYFSVNIKKSLPITLYILIGALNEAYLNINDKFNLPNTPQNIYNTLEAIFVGWIIYSFIKDRQVRKIILALAGIFLLMCIVILCRINSMYNNNIVIRGGSTLVSIIFCLLYVFQLSKETNIKIWELFISGAFLFYFVTTAAMFSLIHLFRGEEDQQYYIYFSALHLLANFGLNVLLALGIYKCKVHSL